MRTIFARPTPRVETTSPQSQREHVFLDICSARRSFMARTEHFSQPNRSRVPEILPNFPSIESGRTPFAHRFRSAITGTDVGRDSRRSASCAERKLLATELAATVSLRLLLRFARRKRMRISIRIRATRRIFPYLGSRIEDSESLDYFPEEKGFHPFGKFLVASIGIRTFFPIETATNLRTSIVFYPPSLFENQRESGKKHAVNLEPRVFLAQGILRRDRSSYPFSFPSLFFF